MYLISENYSTRKYGMGSYICNVYLVTSLKREPTDISQDVASIFDLQYKDGSISIPHGSGTGIMVLTSHIKKGEPKALVYDVSVFNQ